MIYTIEMLIDKITKSEKSGYDIDKIKRAYELANEAHQGQVRSSGEPYISHPLAVAYILLDYYMDTDTICAALLHDVVEDTVIPLDTLRKKFGESVALLVDGVTKIGLVPLNTKEEQAAENIRKILIAMSKDIRVMIVKLADRLHNMRTLDFRPPHKQRNTSAETMSFYAPIAHRLGIYDIKEEMEDLALRYLDPFGFKDIEEQLKLRKEQRESFIDSIKVKIQERMTEIVPPPKIEGRVKSIYSIYKKVYTGGKNFDEIYDVYAVRIIVGQMVDCYSVLGIIHDMFKPIPYRFKDYISTPKPNRYQSLHTTVMGREGIPFEVQIRTVEMHNTAQYGVAAHWKYKAGITGTSSAEKRFEWIRQILEQQQEADDIEQITDAVRIDLAPDDVYVFTPKGDVITLPKGSTVIDFAYAIHTQVGNKMTGAKVGGRMASFDYELKTGEIVQIITTNSPTYGPNRNWLEIVRTNEAKSKIKGWHKREKRDENIHEGKQMLEIEFKRNGFPVEPEYIERIAKRQRFDNVDDFYAAIGYRGFRLSKIMQKVKEHYTKTQEAEVDSLPVEERIKLDITKKQQSGVLVEGMDNCQVKFAQCCNPLPGDDIIGFITKGHGVSIHKKDCENVINSFNKNTNTERWIQVMWTVNINSNFKATLDIICDDRVGMLSDISLSIADAKLGICELNTHQLKNGNAIIVVVVEVAGKEQLKNLMTRISKIKGVISVERSGKN